MAENNASGSVEGASTGELFKRLSEQTSTLVRQEVELAKAELSAKGKEAGIGAGLFGGAGLVAVLGLAAVTAALIAALDTGMDLWLAAVIVGVVYFAIAGVMALVAKQRVQRGMPPTPEQTAETVKEDVQWAKSQLKSARR